MATRPVVIRLSAENADKVKALMRDLGDEGQKGLKRIEQAGKPASRGLQLVNTAALEASQGLDQLAARAGPLGGIARSLGPIGLALGAAAGAAVALGVAARRAAADVAEIGDAADRAGVAVDTYEQLRAALIQVGQPTGTLESALSALNRRIGEARAGAGEASKVFRALDIELTDAEGPRSFEEVLADIADRFQDLDASQRLALGQKLGEETFRSLVPVLEQGSEGLRRYAEDAERLGLLFGGETIRTAQELNIAFERQSTIVGVQMKTAFLQAGPAVVELTENFVALLPPVIEFFATLSRGVVVLGDFLGLVEQPLNTQLSNKVQELRQVQDDIRTLVDSAGVMRGPTDTGSGAQRLAELRDQEAALLAQVRALSEQAEALRRLEEAAGNFSGFTPPDLDLGTAGAGAGAQAGAFEKAMQQIAQQIEQQELARREIGLTAGEVARLRAEVLLTAAAQEEFGVVSEELAVLIDVVAGELGRQTESTNALTEAEKRNAEAAKNRAKAQEEAARVMTDAIEQAGDALARMVEEGEFNLRRLGAVLLQTFAGSGPFGGLVNQALGVQGGGFVQAIVGGLFGGAGGGAGFGFGGEFQVPRAAHGADFTVPGTGGVDSQLLAMRVTPGERVKVESQPRRERGGGEQPVAVQLMYNISSDNPAFVEEVLERNRPRFIKDARDATMKALIGAKRGARGTLGRVL